MKRILLHTNAYGAFMRDETDAKSVIQSADKIGISSICLGELLAGFAIGNSEKKNKEELREFLHNSRVRVYPIDDMTPIYYAQIYRILRKQDKPIPTNDMWIAATALQHGSAIHTYEKHFSCIDGFSGDPKCFGLVKLAVIPGLVCNIAITGLSGSTFRSVFNRLCFLVFC